MSPYAIRQTPDNKFQVGVYSKHSFDVISTHDTEDKAASRISHLNGGMEQGYVEQIIQALDSIAESLNIIRREKK